MADSPVCLCCDAVTLGVMTIYPSNPAPNYVPRLPYLALKAWVFMLWIVVLALLSPSTAFSATAVSPAVASASTSSATNRQALEAIPVEVVALFKDRAMVKTAAGQQLLRIGETSKFGVTLLGADTHSARVRYQQKIYTLQLSERVGTSFVVPKVSQVNINRNTAGQYRIRGSINDRYVDFVVDTGASVVAMSEVHARSIGLEYKSATLGSVQTAQGNAPAYFMPLDKITIGSITVRGVRATIIQGNFPTDVLLGMSFLSQVRMQDGDGVLTLTAQY